jgi:hypothetical protein
MSDRTEQLTRLPFELRLRIFTKRELNQSLDFWDRRVEDARRDGNDVARDRACERYGLVAAELDRRKNEANERLARRVGRLLAEGDRR